MPVITEQIVIQSNLLVYGRKPRMSQNSAHEWPLLKVAGENVGQQIEGKRIDESCRPAQFGNHVSVELREIAT